ncbi:MAG: hypothetical protein PHQ52_06225 [Candidatus Omnitrophica bacterium]|nr:hypothetical protein [Candidatus Omnitrophota bacterium]
MIKNVFFIFCLFAVILLSINIDAYHSSSLYQKGIDPAKEDILHKMLGQFTNTLSAISFTNADIYFHGGIYDQDHDPVKCMLAENDHEQNKTNDISNETFFMKLYDATHITEHRHISGNEYKELLPWIEYAVKLDSNNIQAYNLGGYWLIYRMNLPDKGISLLKEGIRNNPDAWQLYATLGLFYYQQKDTEKSEYYLTKASDLGKTFGMDKVDKHLIYTPLAEIYKNTGKISDSITLYQELEKDFPDDPAIKTKIEEYQAML